MIRHIVMLNFKEGFSPEENRQNAAQIKSLLEGLQTIVPGIIEFKVSADVLSTSDKDIVFNALFESVDALAAYQSHPEHLKIASYVASVMRNRVCVDYEE